MLTVKEILQTSAETLKSVVGDRALFEARLLVGHCLKIRVEEIAVRDHELVEDGAAKAIADLVARRLKREPMAYLLGKKEFYGNGFEVNSSVLIPRPESEAIIDVVLKWVAQFGRRRVDGVEATRPGTSDVQPLRILDLGTGSGCLALTLAKIFVDQCGYKPASLEVVALDISEAALSIFESNRNHLGLAASVVRAQRGDILQGPQSMFGGDAFDTACDTFDIIVSNPPYIPTKDMATLSDDIRLYEPRSALDGGDRGLLFYDAIVEKWLPLLRPGGLCVLETYSEEQRRDICHDLCGKVAADTGAAKLVDLRVADAGDLRVAEGGNLRVAEQGCLLVISLPVSR